jgi:hypothetical protein
MKQCHKKLSGLCLRQCQGRRNTSKRQPADGGSTFSYWSSLVMFTETPGGIILLFESVNVRLHMKCSVTCTRARV